MATIAAEIGVWLEFLAAFGAEHEHPLTSSIRYVSRSKYWGRGDGVLLAADIPSNKRNYSNWVGD
jgi:hypothetical protein